MAAVPLRVTGATRHYGRGTQRHTVFQDLDLSVAQGEVLALLGPSGCGKSTLLRTIAGLESLDHGTIDLQPSPGGRDIGIVFQQPLLLPWLTVAGNIELGLRYTHNRGARSDTAVSDILDTFGLAHLADAWPDELSGGQAQRVALARTVVTRPAVILLDEPFAALDPLTRRSLQQWLRGLHHDLALTSILVTHDIDEAITLGDTIALMAPSPGRICRTWCSPAGQRSPDGVSALRADILAAWDDLAGASPAATPTQSPALALATP